MALIATYLKRTFNFSFQAKTSRGVMPDKASWFIKLLDPASPLIYGLGECGPLPGLSVDAIDNLEEVLKDILETISSKSIALNVGDVPQNVMRFVPPEYPSIRFGFETALRDLINGGKRIIFQNKFISGDAIPINGLIWMGDEDFLVRQIDAKIAAGFSCIKMKIGGLDFDKECSILHFIRKKYKHNNITLRLDANGGFLPEEALHKLQTLAEFDIHSIEQPIRPGLAEMEELCKCSPIPIALDEELIGINDSKEAFLQKLKPQYVILKPTLHGGFLGCEEWIKVAEKLGIRWWITSALESNIGLNAICQFTKNYTIERPHGLGTGMIYGNNIASPLKVKNGYIYLDNTDDWDVDIFKDL